MIPEGIIPPVLTPLTEGRAVDEAAFCRLLDKLIDGGVHGLFVAGTAGLGSCLSEDDYRRVIDVATAHVAGRRPILAGVLEPSTARVVDRMRRLPRSGLSAVVVVAPYYMRAQNDRQLLRHFEVIRNNTGEDLVVYNIPGCTGTEIPVRVIRLRVIRHMAERGWILGCKDSSSDAEYFREGIAFPNYRTTRLPDHVKSPISDWIIRGTQLRGQEFGQLGRW